MAASRGTGSPIMAFSFPILLAETTVQAHRVSFYRSARGLSGSIVLPGPGFIHQGMNNHAFYQALATEGTIPRYLIRFLSLQNILFRTLQNLARILVLHIKRGLLKFFLHALTFFGSLPNLGTQAERRLIRKSFYTLTTGKNRPFPCHIPGDLVCINLQQRTKL